MRKGEGGRERRQGRSEECKVRVCCVLCAVCLFVAIVTAIGLAGFILVELFALGLFFVYIKKKRPSDDDDDDDDDVAV